MLFNGPFVLASWVHGASMRFEKNPTYWNRAAVKLNVIDIAYMTRDANARLNLFQDGRVADVDYLPGEALDQVLQQRWPLHRYNEGSMWMLQVNHRPGYVDGERPPSPCLAARERSGRARLQSAEDAELYRGRVVVPVRPSKASAACFARSIRRRA